MRNEADIGKHYERQILALLSLKCLLDESIEDFWIKFNPADVVKFDDIVLHVEYKNGQKELFLVQLKHRKGPTAPMIAKMFQSKKNDSNVECLQEAFKNITEGKKFFINNGISEDTKKFFVLYNNAEVHMGSTEDSDIESVVNEQNTIMESTKQRSTITKLRFEPMDKTDFRSFLSSRTFAESTGYKLKSKKQFHDYNQNFLDNFYFYPDQLNLEEVTPEIERLIGLKHVADHLIHYFDEFTKPTNEKEKIVKLDVKVQVLSSIFGNFQPPAEEESCSTLLNIAKKFDVTLISDEQSENAVWAEIITEMRKNYSENDLEISNWQHRLPENLQAQFPHTRIKDLYFQMVATKKIPLYIKTDNLSLTVFLESTFSKMDVNMVIFNVKKEKLQFTNLKIFETMGDIDKDLFDSFMKNTYISFKGKQKMKLLSIVEFDDSMKEKITVDLFIKLLGKPLKIGDEEKSESIYINRTLRIQMIEEGILEENRKIIFIICNFPPNEKFRKLVFNGTEGIFQTYYDPYFGLIEEFCNVYTIDKSYGSESIDDISKLTISKPFCILQYVGKDEDGCKFILRKTIGQWDVLKRHISEATKKDSELTKFFEKTEVNFICNKGGMGKSMLLKHLLKMFPSNKWVIHVELGKHRSAFDKIDNFEDFMKYFYESGLAGSDKNFPDISRQLYQYCTKNEKIVLLLDDCDEVVDKKLLLFLKEASNMGIKLWIVARPGLREEFEHFFETFSMELTAFTGKDQMRFFRKFFRKRSKSKQELQRKLRSIDKVRSSLENSFIGNCQQTMMLAVLFDTNEETVLKQNRVDEIYEKFINLKIQQQYERNQGFIVRTVSKLALTNFFSKNILSKIFDWAEFQCDIEVFKNENSKTALVTYFDKNNIPEFTHKTYAEFLAGRWLAHTLIKQIVKETPFDLTEVVRTLYLQELTNVRFFFDSILTKSNPLKFRFTGLLETDILSRNILHIYLSYGDRYDMHTVSEVEEAVRMVEEHSHIKYDDGIILVRVPDPVSTTKHTNDKFVKTCMPIIDIKRLCHQKDIFLNMNPVECALLSGCLKKLNEILVYDSVSADFSTMDYNKRFILLVHCTKNHLNFILRRVDKLILDETLLKMNTKKPEGDIGKHYERKITALIALKCLLRNDIHDFWLTTNHSGIEKFDDLVLHVEFKDKRKEIFFMQLKHKQKGDKPIVVEMFKTNQKDFCLEMYQNAYESIIKNEEFLFANNISKDTDMFFVLYNNCKVEIMSKDSSKLRFDKLEQKYFRSFISSNSSEDVSTEYTITDSETDAEFLKRFYFFAGQLHLTEVPNEIAKLVGLDIDFVINILNFFYDFADSNNTIQKLHKLNLKSKLLGYIFSVFVPPNKCSKNYHILSVINTFNVTLIHEEYSEVVIWSDIISSMKEYYKEESLELDNWEVALPMELQNKFRTKLNFTNEVNINTKHLYFHMVAQRLLPFYIETKNIFFNTFFNEIMTKLDIITVIRDTKNFFGKHPEFPNAQNEGDFKLLKTVDDLDENQYLTLTKRVQVSLQGKQYVQLSDLVDNDNRDLRKTFSIDTLIHLLDKNLRFGSSGIKAEIYIERRLKIPILNESILKYGPCIFVICGNYSPKNFVSVPLEVGVAIFRHLNTVMKLPCEFIPLPVLTVNRSLDRSIMKEVKELAKNRFYCILQFFDEKDGSQRFILKDTNGSLEKIEYDILANEYYLLNDDELFESTKNSNINVICNNAGMGKTMFLNRIRNKFSPTEWVIHLALGKYSSEIKKIESYTEFIEFLSKMDWQTDDDKKDTTIIEILFHHHIERRKMVLLIDDYEEINDRKLLKILKEGMENGLRIWMVSRPLLKMELEENFGVLSMELDEFTVADQNKFFRLFFSSKNDSGDVEKKMSLVEKTREKFQNSFIGICQQTMMLAVVINSNEHVFDDRIRIHELYERFIDIHILKDSKKTRFILRTMSKLALYSFFSKAVLEMLFDWDEFVCDLEIFNEENPKPALVMESRIESIPVFSHKTYAEFLAAKWLADIVIKQIKKETPFDISEAFKLLYCQELTNVRLFFDNILTTDNPLLSSIINNDIPKDILWNSGNETDILGRTTYHMLLSYGKRYIIHTDLEARNTLQNIEERAVFQMAQQLITIEVPDFVPKSESNYTENNVFLFGFHEQLLKEDILLHKNAIEYALMSGSLEKLDSVLKTEFLISNMPTEFLFRNIEFDTLFITLLHCIKNNFNMLFLKLVSLPNICNSLQKVRENPSGKSLLHLAVESKNLQAVRTLLLNYNNIESWGVDNEKNTPLHLVNDFEDPSILKDFFALGKYTAALVNRKNIKGFSHLHCFASRGNEIWVKKLLNIPGVEANVKCIQGRTPFILSVMEGHIKVAIILKNNRAKINKGDKNNNTALHYAVLRGDFECTEQLLEWGVEVNAKNSHGLTPLMQAASRGYLDIMVRLLLSGAIINLMDRNGWTALHYAIMEKHYDIIQLLLREGADTKKITKDGQTPLITACIHNVPKAVEMLIDCGRDVRMNYHSLPEGGNALDIARRRGHLSCARPLVGLTKLRIPRTVLPSRTAPQNRRNRSRSERISHQSEDSDRFQRLILAQNLTVSVDIQVRMPSEI